MVREIGIRYKKEYLKGVGANFVEVKEFKEIYPGIHLTGVVPKETEFEPPDPHMQIIDPEVGWIQDQLNDDLSLAIETKRGIVVILGCAHAGIINILNQIQRHLPDRPIHTVIGGTHLGFADPAQFDSTFSALVKLDIKRLGAAHCTGLENGARLYNLLGDRYFFASAGVSISI